MKYLTKEHKERLIGLIVLGYSRKDFEKLHPKISKSAITRYFDEMIKFSKKDS